MPAPEPFPADDAPYASGADPAEARRVQALADLQLLHPDLDRRKEHFDRVVRLARRVFDVPMVAVNLIDAEHQHTAAAVGLDEGAIPREEAFCDHTIRRPGAMVVEDAQLDERFAQSRFVTGDPGIRFYAGQPLAAPGGEQVGALCIIDDKPRTLSDRELELLRDLADWVERELALDEELSQAARVQRSLLPRTEPGVPGLEVAARCHPARQVGGDFFDWYELDGSLQVLVADVMGKGTGAAILAAGVRAALRSASQTGGLARAVTIAGRSLQPDLDDNDAFVTLMTARICPDTGVMSYVDAGHGLAFVASTDGGARPATTGDVPVGAWPGWTWAEGTDTLAPGETLVIVSDGILDAYPDRDSAVADIAELCRTAPDAAAVVERLAQVRDHPDVTDDLTVLAVRRFD